MSFDARSLERLQALGRQLPQPLPRPEPPAASGRPRAEAKLHAVERESDPEQLFRELMQASADGTVPPHLLDRLRSLEQARAAAPVASTGSAATGQTAAAGSPAAERSRRSGGLGRSTKGSRPAALSADERSLYDAFEDLLHLQEADEEPAAPRIPDRQRPPAIDLQPKPTLRRTQDGR